MFQKALGSAGAQIAQYAGCDTKVPNMRNGRCFPTSLALCQCPPDVLAQWLQVPRNHLTGTPIKQQNFNIVTDTLRHDFELAFAKQSAQDIINKLQQCPSLQPVNARVLHRLEHGHTTEEEDLRPIAIAVGFNLEILDFSQQAFLDIRVGAGLPTFKMILAGHRENDDHPQVEDRANQALHWEPVVTLPPFSLLLASSECLAALGVNMKYNPIAEIRSQLATTIRQVRKQRRRIQDLEAGMVALGTRLAALEQGAARAKPTPKPTPKVRPKARTVSFLFFHFFDSPRVERIGVCAIPAGCCSLARALSCRANALQGPARAGKGRVQSI